MGADADVLVIGAGMAGLTAARELVREGLDVTVVEAAYISGLRAASEARRLLKE